jgi:hypothetical protein
MKQTPFITICKGHYTMNDDQLKWLQSLKAKGVSNLELMRILRKKDLSWKEIYKIIKEYEGL